MAIWRATLSLRGPNTPLSGRICRPGFVAHERVVPRSIPGPVDGLLRIEFVISGRPEIAAFLTTFPRPFMLILLVGIAQAKAFMLHLTSPPPRNDIKAVSQHIHCWQHGVLTSTAWHRHKSGNAHRPSTSLPCGCRSSVSLVRGWGCICPHMGLRGVFASRSLLC